MPAARGLTRTTSSSSALLEHDDRRHELRDARDRASAAGVAAREHGAVLADEVPRGGRDVRLGSLSVGARGLDGQVASAARRATTASRALRITGATNCSAGAYHPAAAHTCAASRCASAAAAARQSASLSRYAKITEREAVTSALAGPA